MEGCSRNKVTNARYNMSEKGKARHRRYNLSEKGKLRKRLWRRTEHGREWTNDNRNEWAHPFSHFKKVIGLAGFRSITS